MATNRERVEIWNSFRKLAWSEAKSLKAIMTGSKEVQNIKLKGGILPDDKYRTLSLLVLCNLAIEARANHLIHEIRERNKLTIEEAEIFQWLSTGNKWFLLPKLAGVKKRPEKNKMPHQAISRICSYRNNLIHVKYEKIVGNSGNALPNPREMISLYNNFVRAVENMNVILGWMRKERKSVLKKLLV